MTFVTDNIIVGYRFLHLCRSFFFFSIYFFFKGFFVCCSNLCTPFFFFVMCGIQSIKLLGYKICVILLSVRLFLYLGVAQHSLAFDYFKYVSYFVIPSQHFHNSMIYSFIGNVFCNCCICSTHTTVISLSNDIRVHKYV